ncbi:MAG: Holliday junction resolvase RuvX [Candidatus Sumerlaeaceae bacterium]|nr:Holliday junction resolvase RuvX [Candidatus Sumerlaeaceae bacterium]
MVVKHVERIMALDVGDRWIGVAVSDELQKFARPVEVIDRRKTDALHRLIALARAHCVGTIVVGLPKNMDGTEGSQAAKCRKFASALQAEMQNVSVVFWDERWTSQQAKQVALETRSKRQRQRETLDAVSACVILQNYLDHLQQFSATGPSGQLIDKP